MIHNGQLHDLKGKKLGAGGCKIVFGINDSAIALLNITTNDIDTLLWERIVREEITIARQAKAAGLQVIPYERTTVYFDGNPTTALQMPTFQSLLAKGMQIRDPKNTKSSCGTSMIFGNKDNLQNSKYWEGVLQGFQEDLIAYYTYGFSFDSDSFNLLIADTSETPSHDQTEPGLVTERKQKLHFYFYDFTNKNRAADYKPVHKFIDEEGNILQKEIESSVSFMFKRAVDVILCGLFGLEYSNILGEQCLLKPQDTIFSELGWTDKKLMEVFTNYYGKYPLVDLCAVLKLHTISEPALKEIKQHFITAVSEQIVNNLAQLPIETLKERFGINSNECLSTETSLLFP